MMWGSWAVSTEMYRLSRPISAWWLAELCDLLGSCDGVGKALRETSMLWAFCLEKDCEGDTGGKDVFTDLFSTS